MLASLCNNLDSAMEDNKQEVHDVEHIHDDDDEEEEEEQSWDDWTTDGEEGDEDNLELLCLFCYSFFNSSNSLFDHCSSRHSFDFRTIKATLKLDYNGCFKLLNYVRSQVAKLQCWSCGSTCKSRQELQDHLHEPPGFESSDLPWDSDMYLKPYIEEDNLLYSFDEDEEVVDADIVKNIDDGLGKLSIDEETDQESYASDTNLLKSCNENEVKGITSISATNRKSSDGKKSNKSFEKAFREFMNVNKEYFKSYREFMNVNKEYFKSYSSFGIHKEMLSDKVRTDAYRQAIVDNPSLFNGSVVLDVGCGTGILSLFAAQGGALMVYAVEASDKMATVASQIAKDNGLLWNEASNGSTKQESGVIKVINSMVEFLFGSDLIKPKSVDVLVSEWMGYCLLYESMLSCVLFARDQWLKPGGAILPDAATMFVAGFGKGATSIPFWEDVYGFNMSSIGKESVKDAARIPIIAVVDGNDLVTNTALLQAFDLMTMKYKEVEFTASVELEQKPSKSADAESTTTKCYGLVLWFETAFTSRFCKEAPTVLSTSPYAPPTHWSQTLLTFNEPISLTSKMLTTKSFATVGSEVNPAVKIDARISISRVNYRSIEILLEVTAIGFDGQRQKWPVQLFSMF